MGYHEFRYWSPIHDRDMVRLSMFNDRDAEFFMLIAASDGKSYRERRNEAVDAIAYAIKENMEPGEVRLVSEAA